MEKEKMKLYYDLWSDCWSMFRKWMMEFCNEDSFWQQCIRDADKFCDKYEAQGVGHFASILAQDILHELENKALKKGEKA